MARATGGYDQRVFAKRLIRDWRRSQRCRVRPGKSSQRAGTPPTSLTAADLNFAKEAAIGGQLEVDAGRIAERGAEEGGRDQAHARRQRALLPPVSGSREKKDAAVAEPVASSAPKRRKRAG